MDGLESGQTATLPELTYIGSFDDKVQQYPWSFDPTLQVLNEQLVTYAFFGNPLLLNDGYFTANPRIHKSLLDGPESIIGALAQEGFIKLYMRDQGRDLIAGIEAAGETGVKDHKANLNDDEWKENVRPFLEEWLPRISWASETWPTPTEANVGRAFYNLLKSRIDSEDLQLPLEPGMLHDAFAQFDRDIDKSTYNSARTVWETDTIPRYLDGFDQADARRAEIRSSLMMLANEAYHIAQTAAASKKFVGRTCRVQTALSTAFLDLIDEDKLPDDFSDRHENARKFLFSPPKTVRVTGSGLRALMFSKSGVGLTKQQYLDCLNAYLIGRATEEDLEKVFNAYRSELANHLSKYWQEGEIMSGFVGYGLGTALSMIPKLGWAFAAATSIGSATVIRWYRKNQLEAELERHRFEELQNIDPAVRKSKPWRASLMALKLKNLDHYFAV